MGAETWIAIGKFVAAVAGFGSAGQGLYFAAVQVARLGLLALASKELTPKLDLTRTAQEKSVTVKDTVHPQRFVYGEDMLSGPLFFGGVNGDDNENLYIAIALTGHEIDSFVEFRLDDQTITLAQLTGDMVAVGKFDSAAWVQYRLGTQAQTCPSLLATDWSSNFGSSTHPGNGHAYMVWKFQLQEDNDAYETGAPKNIRAVIKGKKVYDPRLDSTNGGTGAHRLADASTWEWSDNPALCLADFMRDDKFGMKEPDDRIDWPMVATAADVCDETVSIPGATTQPRYTCNATFDSTMRRGDVRDALLNAMLGRMVFSGGVWKIWAGEAVTATVTIDETNLAGNITLQASAGAKERYNRVRGKYIDPDRNYTAMTYVEQRSTTYETEDGGEVRPLVADFLCTNNEYEAQRKAIITLKQSRQQRVVTFEGNLSCFPVLPGTIINLDVAEFGFTGEKFFVSEWALTDKGVNLTLVEEINANWNDPLVGEYTTRTATGALVFNELGVPAPHTVVVTAATGGVLINWTVAPAPIVTQVEVWASDDNDRNNAVLVATVIGNQYFDQISDGRTRFYWLRSVNDIGARSLYEPNLTTTTYSGTSIYGELVASVPSFAPGFIGGSADFVFTLNKDATGLADDGEIRIQGSSFDHPDGTTITPDSGSFAVNTFYEGAVVGRFYLMYSATAAETRFGGVAADWGSGSPDDTRFVCVTWDSVNLWRARNNAGTYFSFTPLATDCIFAIGDKTATSGGINSLIVLLGGIAGVAGTDGDDAVAVNYTNNAHAVEVSNLGVEDWLGSGGDLYIFEGTTLLTLNTNTQTASHAGLANGEYNLDITKISGDTLTEPAITGAGTTTATLADWASDLTQPTVYRITAYVQTANGSQVTLQTDVTLTPAYQGLDGADGTDAAEALAANYSNNSHAVPVSNTGVETWTGSGGELYVFEGATLLTLHTNTQGTAYPGTNGRFRINITPRSGNTLTEPAISGSGTTTCTVADWAGNLTQATVYRIDIYILTSQGVQVHLVEDVTLTPADQGADGADGADGTNGTNGADGIDGLAANYTNDSHAVPVSNTGVETWTGSGGKFYVYEGGTLLTLNTNTQGTGFPGTNSRFRLNITKVSGDTLGEPSITGSGTTEATLGNWSSNLTTATVYRITAYIRNSAGQTFSIPVDVTLTPANQGDDGADGANGTNGTDGFDALSVNYTNQAHTVPVTNLGAETWTGSGGPLYVYDGGSILTLDQNAQSTAYPAGNGRYRLDIDRISGNTLTEPAITGSGTTTATLANWAGNLTTATIYRIRAFVRNLAGDTFILTTYATITPSNQGDDGADGGDGDSVHVAQIFRRVSPAPSAPTGGAYNFTNNTLTPPTNWSTTPPSGADPLYTSFGTFTIAGTTGTDTNPVNGWSTPVKLDTGGATLGAIDDINIVTFGAGAARWGGFRVDSDGDIYVRQGGSGSTYTSDQTWRGVGASSDFEVRVIKPIAAEDDPDSINAGLNTWLSCGTDRTWEWESSGAADDEISNVTVSFRRTSDNLVLGSLDVSVNVQYS